MILRQVQMMVAAGGSTRHLVQVSGIGVGEPFYSLCGKLMSVSRTEHREDMGLKALPDCRKCAALVWQGQ